MKPKLWNARRSEAEREAEEARRPSSRGGKWDSDRGRDSFRHIFATEVIDVTAETTEMTAPAEVDGVEAAVEMTIDLRVGEPTGAQPRRGGDLVIAGR